MMSSAPPPAASALRAALVLRCGDVPLNDAWRAVGADAFLCRLSRTIAAALEQLASSVEVARARLQSAREALRGADESHCDELAGQLSLVESFKRNALEQELCAVDAILERLRADRSAVIEAATTLNESELEERHAELAARLDAADARLLALPTSVIEPPHAGLAIDEPALLAGAAVFGRLIAPRAIRASDLTLEGAPRRTWPGDSLQLRLLLQSALHVSQSAEELEVSLGAASASAHVEASLAIPGVAPQPLIAVTRYDVPQRCVVFSVDIPPAAPVGSSVCFGPLTVSGQPVDGLLGPVLVETPCPSDLSPEHAAQLQAWLPPGGSTSPGSWEEVYRATAHGFGAADFHAKCDGQPRLLVLVRSRKGGWLFGGFTTVGFSLPEGPTADPTAFLFSLTNAIGRPEKLESKRAGWDVYYDPCDSARFGAADLGLCSGANVKAKSWTCTGTAFAASASKGVHPMARKWQGEWLAAEVVAWTV